MRKVTYQTANRSGRSRRETLNAREHIVVPMTMIVPGVLTGSRGPLFYPEKEVKRSAFDWNGMPILLGHPSNGSGRAPDIINRFGVGMVFESKFERGNLCGEAWFDVIKLRQLAPDALNQIESGKKLELSTGFNSSFDDVPGIHNGEKYTASVVGIRPDHLAVFVNGERGACSVKQGCGVNNCDCNDTTIEELMAWSRRKYGQVRGEPLGLPTMEVN